MAELVTKVFALICVGVVLGGGLGLVNLWFYRRGK